MWRRGELRGGHGADGGTCLAGEQTLLAPGAACNVYSGDGVCPWNYPCNSSFFPGGQGGTCVATNCSLTQPETMVSAASITIHGDGPDQTYGFACQQTWGHQFTGEAVSHLGHFAQPPEPQSLFVSGCYVDSGDAIQGIISFEMALNAAGTTTVGELSYQKLDQDWSNVAQSGDPLPSTFTVTSIDDNAVAGSFDAMVVSASGAETLHLTGTFDVCHVPDHDLP